MGCAESRETSPVSVHYKNQLLLNPIKLKEIQSGCKFGKRVTEKLHKDSLKLLSDHSPQFKIETCPIWATLPKTVACCTISDLNRQKERIKEETLVDHASLILLNIGKEEALTQHLIHFIGKHAIKDNLEFINTLNRNGIFELIVPHITHRNNDFRLCVIKTCRKLMRNTEAIHEFFLARGINLLLAQVLYKNTTNRILNPTLSLAIHMLKSKEHATEYGRAILQLSSMQVKMILIRATKDVTVKKNLDQIFSLMQDLNLLI